MAHGITSTGMSLPNGMMIKSAKDLGVSSTIKRIISKNTYDIGAVLTNDNEIVVWGGTRTWTYRQTGINHTLNVWHGSVVLAMPSSCALFYEIVDASVVGTIGYALYSNGDLVTWGANNAGQIGHGAPTNSIPKIVRSGVSKVFAPLQYGYGQSNAGIFVLDTDGQLYFTGYNGVGIIGDGGTVNKTSFTRVDAAKFPANSVKNVYNHAGTYGCAFIQKTDNTIWACGYNGHGQLGNGATTNPNTWVDVTTNWGGAVEIAEVVGGYGYYDSGADGRGMTAIRFTNGKVMVAGNRTWGSLGDGVKSNTNISVPQQLIASGCTQISCTGGGPASMHAIVSGLLYGWGYNAEGNHSGGTLSYWGPLGIGGTGPQSNTASMTQCLMQSTNPSVNGGDPLPTMHSTEGILMKYHNCESYSYRHTFFVKDAGGTVYSVGRNNYGNLGIGVRTSDYYSLGGQPLEAQYFIKNEYLRNISEVFTIGYGDGHAYMTLQDGELYMWGYNGSGLVEPGRTGSEFYNTPTRKGRFRI